MGARRFCSLIVLLTAVGLACLPGPSPAAVTVVSGSANFMFDSNVPTGSTVPASPVDIALAGAGTTPFAISQYGGPHTIAHLNDGSYGNSYSWISAGLSDARSVALGGSYGSVTMSFAGVALPTAQTVNGFAFGRSNLGEYGDRIAGTMYLQYTTSASNVTDISAANDGIWTTFGSVTTNDVYDHRFAFTTPVANMTGFRVVTQAGNCIDEIALYGSDYIYAPPPPVTVGAGSQFTYTGYVGKGLTAVPVSPTNLAQVQGATPFAIDCLSGYSAHSIPHLNDGIYSNANSWIGATTRAIDLGGSYGSVTNEFAGIAMPGPTTLTGFSFGRDNTNAFTDRNAGTYYVQVTTAVNAADTSAASDSQWTTVGSLSAMLDPYDKVYTFASPIVGATGLRIVAGNGNCIDEISLYGDYTPPSTLTWTGGGGANTAWSATANWNPSIAPSGGNAMIFDTNNVANNNDLSSFTCGGITFAATAGAFTLSGNSIALNGGVVNNTPGVKQTIALDLAVAGAQTFNAADGDIEVSGVISGGSITKAGLNKLTLSAVNTYTGGTTVNNGTLEVSPTGSLPANGDLTMNTGGTLVLNSSQQIGRLNTGTGGTIELAGGSTLTINQTGADTGNVGPTVNITGDGNLVKAGPQHLRLFGALSYSGSTTVNGSAVLVLQGANTTLPTGTLLTVNGQAQIDLGGHQSASQEIRGLAGDGSVYSTWAPGAMLTINVPDGESYTHTGRLYINGPNGNITLTKTGDGTQVLGGTLSYKGPTTVNGGTLVLNGAVSNSAVVVNGGGTLGGTGTLSQTVTVAGGADAATQGAIDLTTDAAVGALTLNNGNAATTVLTLGGPVAGDPSVLKFDLGDTAADMINLTAGQLLVNPGGGIVNITALGAVNPGVYNLITFTSGQATGLENLSLDATSLGGQTLALRTTATAEQLIVGTIAAWWKGGNGGDWNATSPYNWTTDAAGTTPVTALPTGSIDVHFAASGASNLNTTLGQDFTIGSLTFEDSASSSVTIGGTNTLTIRDGGITTTAGSGSHTISANVALGTSQTWTINNDPAKPLTVSGSVSGVIGTEELNKAGTGKLVLSGAASYTGMTTVNAGTLQIESSGSLAGPVTVNGAGTLTSTGSLNAVTVNGGGVLVADGGTLSALTVGAGYSGMATINASAIGPAVLSVPAGTTGNINLNHVNAMTSLGVGSGTVTLGNGVNIANGTNTAVSLTGGTLKVADSPTAAATVARADFSNYSVGNYTVNTQSGKLAISSQLNLPDGITAAYTPGGGAMSFAASGSNLADNSAARTLTLSGGTLTIAGSPAVSPAGANNFSEYGTTVNAYQDSFDGTSLGPGWNLSDGLNAAVSGGTLTLTFGTNTTQPFSYTHNSLLYTQGSTTSTQTVLAKVRFNNVGTGDATGRAGVTACTPVDDNGIRLLARNGAHGGSNNLEYLNEAIAWGPLSASGIWSSSKDYWMRLTYNPADGSMIGKLWLADGVATEPMSPVQTTDQYYGTWTSSPLRNGYAGLSIGTQDNMNVDYILIENSGLPSLSNVGVGLPASTINLPNTTIAATASSTLSLPAGDCTLGNLSILNSGTTLTLSGTTGGVFNDIAGDAGTELLAGGIALSFASGNTASNITAASVTKVSDGTGGGGTLTLSGSNTFANGTTVNAGTLVVNNAGGLGAGGTLTIASGGTVVLSSGLSAAWTASGGSAATVPEPGTVALLAVGLGTLVVAAWRRRRYFAIEDLRSPI